MRRLINKLKSIEDKLQTLLRNRASKIFINSQLNQLSRHNNLLFIIGLKGSLHIIQICLRYVPKTENVVLILNGMDPFEIEYVRKNLKVARIVVVKEQLKHGEIMDYLFSNMKTNFGILDYDCFIIDPTYFQKIKQIKDNSMGNVLFMYHNPVLGLEVPLTHFMYFNTPLTRKIIKEYEIRCSIKYYKLLSDKIKQKMREIGIDENHLTEDFKDYLDTMRVLFSVGIAEGYPFHWIDRNVDNDADKNVVFHPGGVSDPRILHNRWRLRGSYFWQSALEKNPDKLLREYYSNIFGPLPSVLYLKEQMIIEGHTGPGFFNSVEKILT